MAVWRRIPGMMMIGVRASAWLALWAPVAVLLWPDRPYLLDLLAMLSGYLLVVYALAAGMCFCLRWRRLARNVVFAGLALAALECLQAWPGPAAALAAPRRRDLTIITWNCHGNDPVDAERFLLWAEALRADVISLIEPPGEHAPLRQVLRGKLRYHESNRSPATVFSRFPLRLANEARPAGRAALSAEDATPLFALELDDGTQLDFAAVHLQSPRAEDRWENAVAKAVLLGAWLRDAGAGAPRPLVVAGDFNSTPLGRSFREFSQASGLRPAASDWPATGTWPAALPAWLALPIDHVWVSGNVEVRAAGVGPDLGTIHRPVWAALAIPEAPARDVQRTARR